MSRFPALGQKTERKELCGERERCRRAQVEVKNRQRHPAGERRDRRHGKHRDAGKPRKLGSIRAETLRNTELLCETDESFAPVPRECGAETVSSKNDCSGPREAF